MTRSPGPWSCLTWKDDCRERRMRQESQQAKSGDDSTGGEIRIEQPVNHITITSMFRPLKEVEGVISVHNKLRNKIRQIPNKNR